MNCPCCGQQIGRIGNPDALVSARVVGGTRLSILRLIARAYPLGVDVEDVVDAYYSGSSNPSHNAEKMTRKAIADLRLALKQFGWTIPRSDGGRAGPGSYRLEKIREID